ncbi:MAG: outer membrane beta-barrel protein [Acidobacteriota bacterium]|nr:outer membrane beta-barrel protein [Acidobacteriota bacterium]
MKKLFVVVLLLMLSACAFAQKDYVGRYDVYTGYTYLGSPDMNLTQRGLNVQAGLNLRRWLAFGVDYSVEFGRGTLTAAKLKPALHQELVTLLGETTANSLAVPFDATTQTFAAGPNIVFHPRKRLAAFVHPSIGAIHENITIDPLDSNYVPIAVGVVTQLEAQGTIKTTKPNDTTYFYGLGGGFEYAATKHVHIRTDIEFVHVFLYESLLANSRNSVRVSIGPTFNFGKNVSR